MKIYIIYIKKNTTLYILIYKKVRLFKIFRIKLNGEEKNIYIYKIEKMFIYDINHGKPLEYNVFRTFNTGSYYGDICATR